MPPRTISVSDAMRGRFKNNLDTYRPETAITRDVKPIAPRLICLTLPIPPSVNDLFCTIPNGKRVKSARGKNYVKTVAGIALLARCTPFAGTVGVKVKVFRAKKWGDLDNYNKSLFDSLTGLCWVDDSQIIYIESHRFDDPENPRVEIEVWEVEP